MTDRVLSNVSAVIEASADILSNEQLDSLLAQELSKLSMADRQEAEFDIHGVAEEVKETPDMVQQQVKAMQAYLVTHDSSSSRTAATTTSDGRDGRNSSHWSCYLKAKQQNPAYVSDPKLLLSFLRAERFQVEAAADRMCSFLELKEKLFGSESISRQITIQDHFDADDQECLKSGVCQLLPIPDRAGRVVLVWNASLRGASSRISRIKTLFYVLYSASQDEGAQCKGIVLIYFNLGEKGNQSDSQIMPNVKPVLSSMPIRFESLHACFDRSFDGKNGAMSTRLIAQGAGVRVRTRSRRHEGTFDEIKLALMCFGIPFEGDIFPMTSEKEFHCGNHHKWYQRRLQEDLQIMKRNCEAREDITNKPGSSQSVGVSTTPRQPGDIVLVPTPLDILMGRSRHCQTYVGTVRYQQRIMDLAGQYEATPRSKKVDFAIELVQSLKDSGSRFLKETEQGWIVVDDIAAREKISNAFRDQRKKQIPPGMSTSKGKDEAATTKTKSPEVSKDESTSAKISRRSGRVANKSYVYSSSSLFSSKDSVSAEILSMPTIGQGVDLTSDDEFELEQIQDVDWQQI